MKYRFDLKLFLNYMYTTFQKCGDFFNVFGKNYFMLIKAAFI